MLAAAWVKRARVDGLVVDIEREKVASVRRKNGLPLESEPPIIYPSASDSFCPKVPLCTQFSSTNPFNCQKLTRPEPRKKCHARR